MSKSGVPRLLTASERERLEPFIDQIHYSPRYDDIVKETAILWEFSRFFVFP